MRAEMEVKMKKVLTNKQKHMLESISHKKNPEYNKQLEEYTIETRVPKEYTVYLKLANDDSLKMLPYSENETHNYYDLYIHGQYRIVERTEGKGKWSEVEFRFPR